MKILKIILTLLFVSNISFADISGTVFQDFNSDGAMDTFDLGYAGITVEAYDSNNLVAATTITDASGNYTLTLPDGLFRVQLTLPNFLEAGIVTATSLASTDFLNSPMTDAKFAVLSPGQYCQENPDIAVPCYVSGDPLVTGAAALTDSLVFFPSSRSGRFLGSGTAPAPSVAAHAEDNGSTWGVAWDRKREKVYTTTVLKRHVGLGPDRAGNPSTGIIYSTDTVSATTSILVDLNADLGITAGTITRAAGDLATNPTSPSTDPNTFDDPGKVAIGDIDISDDNNFLYFTNLANRTLTLLEIDVPTNFTEFAILGNQDTGTDYCQTDDNVDMRPWAVKYYQGQVYVGIVCTMESTGIVDETLVDSRLESHVLVLDTNSGLFKKVVTTDLSFERGTASSSVPTYPTTSANWSPWVSDIVDIPHLPFDPSRCTPTADGSLNFSFQRQYNYPQPILSDIEFDNDGSIVLGYADRLGLQLGWAQILPPPYDVKDELNDNTCAVETSGVPTLATIYSNGDVLRGCQTGSNVWSTDPTTCGFTNPDSLNVQGPSGVEYYHGDNYVTAIGLPSIFDIHAQTPMGGLALQNGTDFLLTTSVNPIHQFDNGSDVAGGVRTLNNTSGGYVQGYELYRQLDPNNPTDGFAGKGVGLGDVELLCDPAPIQVGNRIFADLDGDGIQDPDEPGFAGVKVNLCNKTTGVELASTTTDANGQYLFNGLTSDTGYLVKIDVSNFMAGGPLAGYSLTVADAAADNIDSDGEIIDGETAYCLTTGGPGENDHTIDFGFIVKQAENLTPILEELDNKAFSLHMIARSARRHNRRISRAGVCTLKATGDRFTDIITTYESAWQTIWGIPNMHTSLEPLPASCNAVDITNNIEKITDNYTQLRSHIKYFAGRDCAKADRRSRSFVRKSKRLRAMALQTLATLPNPVNYCPSN